MPLQNRVDPKGNIIATNARGAWLGNRGQLHGTTKQIQRPFKLKAWITCLLDFKGRHRPVMAPNQYTELFFLDEATAFAAGHRPCFECRREDANRFKEAWLKGNPEYHFNKKTLIGEIDDIIHSERISADKSKITYQDDPNKLPDGTFVEYDDEPYLLKGGGVYLWTPAGYKSPRDIPQTKKLTVLTPKSIVNAFAAGYMPQTQ